MEKHRLYKPFVVSTNDIARRMCDTVTTRKQMGKVFDALTSLMKQGNVHLSSDVRHDSKLVTLNAFCYDSDEKLKTATTRIVLTLVDREGQEYSDYRLTVVAAVYNGQVSCSMLLTA